MKIALSLGADFVATGHCQKNETEVNGETVYQLKAGADSNKDQSYFLCQLSRAISEISVSYWGINQT
jgi:tRNA-specific 2-thiouridylase